MPPKRVIFGYDEAEIAKEIPQITRVSEFNQFGCNSAPKELFLPENLMLTDLNLTEPWHLSGQEPRFAGLDPPFLSGQNLGFQAEKSNFCPARGLGSKGIIRGPL